MESKVRVIADKNGNVISVSENNPEYAWINVEQEVPVYERGWLKKAVRKARIIGTFNDLKNMDFKKGQTLPGKIVVLESLTPFNQEEPDRDIKVAGDTGVICRVDDQPIYRRAVYTNNMNAIDELIAHNNGDEIREVQAAQRSIDALKRIAAQKQSADLEA